MVPGSNLGTIHILGPNITKTGIFSHTMFVKNNLLDCESNSVNLQPTTRGRLSNLNLGLVLIFIYTN